MIDMLLTMGLTGGTVVLLWWIVSKLGCGRFPPGWHYGILKLGLCTFLIPVRELGALLLDPVRPEIPAIPPIAAVPIGSDWAAPAGGATQSTVSGMLAPASFVFPAELAKVLVLVWAVGVFGLLGYKLYSYARFRDRILAGNYDSNEPEVLAALYTCQQQLGVAVEVELKRNPLVPTPLVTGLFRPVLVLPEQKLEGEELRYVLLHELTHLKNRDLWVRFFSMLALCLHWWNPIAHLMDRKLKEVSERNCDAQVAAPMSRQERYAYGQVILNAAADMRPGIGAWAAPFSVRSTMEQRLLCVLNAKKMSGKTRALAALMAVLVLACGTAVAISADQLIPEVEEGNPASVFQKTGLTQVEVTDLDTVAGEKDNSYTAPMNTAPQAERTPIPEDTEIVPEELSAVPAQPENVPGEPEQPSVPVPTPVQPEPPAESTSGGEQEMTLAERAANLPEGYEWSFPEDEELYRAYLWQTTPQELLDQLVNGDFPKNSKGETYGSSLLSDLTGHDPDLIAAIGLNGVEGYYRASDEPSTRFADLENGWELYYAYRKAHPGPYLLPLYDKEGNEIGFYMVGGDTLDQRSTGKLKQELYTRDENIRAWLQEHTD